MPENSDIMQLKHIKLARPRRNQAYYGHLARSLTRLASYALELENRQDQPGRVLDIGCGQGELLKCLVEQGFSAMGVDIEPACAAISRQYAEIIVADLFALEKVLPPDSFDVVIASHVLEHVENPRQAIHIIKLLSRRWIIIAVPNLIQLNKLIHRKPRSTNYGHLHGWDMDHLKTLLEKNCGLRIVQWWPDAVFVPFVRRTFLWNTQLVAQLERRLLPSIFPQLANSLVVLCEPVESDTSGIRVE